MMYALHAVYSRPDLKTYLPILVSFILHSNWSFMTDIFLTKTSEGYKPRSEYMWIPRVIRVQIWICSGTNFTENICTTKEFLDIWIFSNIKRFVTFCLVNCMRITTTKNDDTLSTKHVQSISPFCRPLWHKFQDENPVFWQRCDCPSEICNQTFYQQFIYFGTTTLYIIGSRFTNEKDVTCKILLRLISSLISSQFSEQKIAVWTS